MCRAQVANIDLATEWDRALDHADNVYAASKSGPPSAAVAAIDLNETAPALQHDVAALKRAGNSNPKAAPKKKKYDPRDRSTWGKPHKDFKGQTPPSKICLQHWRYGKSAHFCRREDECPWKDYKSPPSN